MAVGDGMITHMYILSAILTYSTRLLVTVLVLGLGQLQHCASYYLSYIHAHPSHATMWKPR